jgi:hypothetical protein
MRQPDFVPAPTSSIMRGRSDQQGMLIEKTMGKKFFCCDAALDTEPRQTVTFTNRILVKLPKSFLRHLV